MFLYSSFRLNCAVILISFGVMKRLITSHEVYMQIAHYVAYCSRKKLWAFFLAIPLNCSPFCYAIWKTWETKIMVTMREPNRCNWNRILNLYLLLHGILQYWVNSETFWGELYLIHCLLIKFSFSMVFTACWQVTQIQILLSAKCVHLALQDTGCFGKCSVGACWQYENIRFTLYTKRFNVVLTVFWITCGF